MAKRNYLNNKIFLQSIVDYKDRLRVAISEGKEKPRIPDYCGKCIELICERMSKRPNFSGYSYREEMVGDATLNCIAVFDNFDPSKSNNPFGYFSRIGWRAMLRRIWDERKETYCKHKNASDLYDVGMHYHGHPDWQDPRATRASDKITSGSSAATSFVGASQDVIDGFERSLMNKKRGPKPEVLTEDKPGISPVTQPAQEWSM